jgi:hypothetical protein
MTTAQLSSIYKGIVNTSSDEDNALRLFEFARQSDFNFRTIMDEHRQIVLAQGHPVYMEVEQDEPDQVDDVDDAMDIAQPVNVAQPINTMHAEAQQEVRMELDQVQVQHNLFPPGNVTIRSVSKNEMTALNSMTSTERKRAIDRLNLNDVDRTRLVNSLWRLRNPERVRQNSRRSYQNRRLQAQA